MKYLYKIIGALLSLAVIPIFIFAPFFKIIASSSIMQMFNNSSSVLVDKAYSFYGLYTEFIQGKTSSGIDIKALINAIPAEVKEQLAPPFITFLAMFALVIIVSLVLFFVFIFTKMNSKTIFFTTALGLLAVIIMNVSFNKFSYPLTTGLIPLTSILTSDIIKMFTSNPLLSLGSGLLGAFSKLNDNIITLNHLSLSTAYILLLLSYIFNMLWYIGNRLVDTK